MEIIFINNTFSDEQLAFFAKHKLKIPKLNEICELLRTYRFPSYKKWGFVCKHYENQLVPALESVDLSTTIEFSLDSKRFVHLDQSKITEAEIREFRLKKEKDFVKIELKPKENE